MGQNGAYQGTVDLVKVSCKGANQLLGILESAASNAVDRDEDGGALLGWGELGQLAPFWARMDRKDTYTLGHLLLILTSLGQDRIDERTGLVVFGAAKVSVEISDTLELRVSPVVGQDGPEREGVGDNSLLDLGIERLSQLLGAEGGGEGLIIRFGKDNLAEFLDTVHQRLVLDRNLRNGSERDRTIRSALSTHLEAIPGATQTLLTLSGTFHSFEGSNQAVVLVSPIVRGSARREEAKTLEDADDLRLRRGAEDVYTVEAGIA